MMSCVLDLVTCCTWLTKTRMPKSHMQGLCQFTRILNSCGFSCTKLTMILHLCWIQPFFQAMPASTMSTPGSDIWLFQQCQRTPRPHPSPAPSKKLSTNHVPGNWTLRCTTYSRSKVVKWIPSHFARPLNGKLNANIGEKHVFSSSKWYYYM